MYGASIPSEIQPQAKRRRMDWDSTQLNANNGNMGGETRVQNACVNVKERNRNRKISDIGELHT